LVLMRAI